MIIAGFQKNSTIDFPGKFSCVVFTANCNYNCYYCHNKHLLGAQAKYYKEEIYEFLKKRKGLIEGVVITGGEPSLYDDLYSFIIDAKSFGYSVKLDTNGSNPDMIKKLIEDDLPEFIAIDYKVPFEKYCLIGACKDTEQNEGLIRRTIKTVMDSGMDYEIRTTMIPEITERDIIEMAKSFPVFDSYVLQKYRPVHGDPHEGQSISLYKREDLERMAELIRVYQPNVSIRA